MCQDLPEVLHDVQEWPGSVVIFTYHRMFSTDDVCEQCGQVIHGFAYQQDDADVALCPPCALAPSGGPVTHDDIRRALRPLVDPDV